MRPYRHLLKRKEAVSPIRGKGRPRNQASSPSGGGGEREKREAVRPKGGSGKLRRPGRGQRVRERGGKGRPMRERETRRYKDDFVGFALQGKEGKGSVIPVEEGT